MSKQTIRIREAQIGDLEQIHSCEQQCFDDPWSFAMLYEEICETPATVYYVAVNKGKVIGYAGMRLVLDEGHILNMCVQSEYRSRGIGKRLLRALQQAAARRGIHALTLEVRVSNRAALRLYKSCGFSIEGVRKKYYQNNGEDAYIMWTHPSNLRCTGT